MTFLQNNLDFFVVIAGAIALLLGILTVHLEIRLSRLLRGKNAKTLEDTINEQNRRITELERSKKDVENYLKLVEVRLKKSIQGVETVRFNPFKGTGSGGNQSFATSLISEKGDGVIFSSLYTRDRVSVFAKPVKNFTPEFELTEEEKESFDKAREIIANKK